ncbi:MAG TPA: aminotransferase class V-fold PLP-dependent enzyme, partial [Cyclobacteriaceae bacterium]|nr:aminotransferase class V-fold PLP-dependent enzyme [Cyclobacteriaceae bacterium]
MINIEQCRQDTPGCKSKIHFNNAGAALMPQPVISAMLDYLALESVTGGYETADLKAAELLGFYDNMSRLLNTQAKNIAFTSSATNSYTRALSSIPFEKGDVILIAQEDYISNQIAFLSMQQKLGVKLVRAASLPEGGMDVDDFKKLMEQYKPKLVSLSHIPTNTG